MLAYDDFNHDGLHKFIMMRILIADASSTLSFSKFRVKKVLPVHLISVNACKLKLTYHGGQESWCGEFRFSCHCHFEKVGCSTLSFSKFRVKKVLPVHLISVNACKLKFTYH